MLRCFSRMLLLSVILFHNFATAKTISVSENTACQLISEQPFFENSFFNAHTSNQNLPIDAPAEHDENSINDIEDTVKIDVVKATNLYWVLFPKLMSGSLVSYRNVTPLALHYDIVSPPPR
jgi:hypothetical protein